MKDNRTAPGFAVVDVNQKNITEILAVVMGWVQRRVGEVSWPEICRRSD